MDVAKLLLSKGASINSTDSDGRTPLHFAAKTGKVDVVRLLLANKASINAPDYYYDLTPLHYAAENGHIDVVTLLLDKGADINAGSKINRTTLSCAVESHNTLVVVELLKRGANVTGTDLSKIAFFDKNLLPQNFVKHLDYLADKIMNHPQKTELDKAIIENMRKYVMAMDNSDVATDLLRTAFKHKLFDQRSAIPEFFTKFLPAAAYNNREEITKIMKEVDLNVGKIKRQKLS